MPTSKMIFVPPRPNLGPEPPHETPIWPVILGAGVFTLAIAVIARIRKRRRKRAVQAVAPLCLPDRHDGSPEEQMIAWAATIREAMASRFGAPWRAKTTEEIACDHELADVLDGDQIARLTAFLGESDRAKFASLAWPADRAVPEPYLKELVALIVAPAVEAGARSRIKG